jgi:hypothetical protein
LAPCIDLWRLVAARLLALRMAAGVREQSGQGYRCGPQ